MFRKIVIVLLCLFMIAGSIIPQKNKVVHAYDSDVSSLEVETNKEDVVNYKTTSDEGFDISSLDIDSEVISKRTSDSKTFRKVDGTYVMAIYNSLIHYEQDGELKDIDNSLIYNEYTNEYENAANSFSIKFPKEIDENKKFKLSFNDYQVSWTVNGIDKSEINYYDNAKVSNNLKDLANISQQLVYNKVQNNVNLEYILNGNQIKENILLDKYIEDFSMTFTYSLKNLVLERNPDGDYVFINEKNEIIFLLNNMVMFDAEGNESSDIGVEVTQIKKDEYQIKINPNDKFLKNAKYPVTVDPTITYYGDDNLIRDKYVYGSRSNDLSYIKVGYSNTYAYRSYLEFDISKIPNDVKINYAHLFLQTYTGKNYCTNDCTIVAKEVYATFDYDDINAEGMSVTSPREVDFDNVHYTDGDTETYMFDITYNLQRWTNSSTPFRTIELRSQNEDEYGYIWFDSENYSSTTGPVVEIGYVDTFGIKDYWTYNSQDVGIVGTGYVADYTGYLTFIRTDFSFETDKQSLGVSFAYSNAEKNSNIGYGDGWNVSYNTKIDEDEDLDLFYTTDYTGNIVYYYPTACPSKYTSSYPYSDTCFVSEDGSGKILNERTIYGSLAGYYIYDGKNRFSFNNSGYLTSIKEIEYNLYITISRDSTNPDRINYVKDSSNNYLRFNYLDNRLSDILLRTAKIESEGAETDYLEKVDYTYEDETNDIIEVQYYSDYNHDNDNDIDETVHYEYDFYNRLQCGYVTEGEKIEYNYINTINDKVMTIESYFDETKFSEVNYEYGFRETIIADHTDSFVIYKFDDYGHTTNIIDKNTNTVNYKYIDIFNDESTYVSGEYNYYLNHELIYQSVPQRLTYNPVENYSFEIGTYAGWSLSSNIAASKSSIEYVGSYSLATTDFTHSGGYAYQDIVLNEGVYTFRASIRNDSSSDTGAYIQALGVSSDEVVNDGTWHYVNVPIYISQDDTTVRLHLYNETGGTVRFDNVSVIDGINDTRVNVVENSSFEYHPSGVWDWDSSYMTWYSINDGDNDIDDTYKWILGQYAVGIKGSPTEINSISSTIERNYFDEYSNGGIFYLGAWANTYSSPAVGNTNYDEDKIFRIMVEFVDASGSVINSEDTQYVNFNQSILSWQYVYGEIEVPSYTYTSARISFEYQGLGEVIFDGLSVFFAASKKIYEYDNLDRLIRITWDDGKEYNFLYSSDEDYYPYQVNDENDNIVMELDSDGSELEYVEKNNIKPTPTYNNYGQVTKIEVYGLNVYEDEVKYFETSTTYMWNNQYLATTTDEFGNITEYQTEELTGLLEHIENAKNVKTQYEYYDNGMLYKVYIGESSIGAPYVKYVYDDKNRLIMIELDEEYSYVISYDDEGRMDEVKVNNQTLMSYSYMENEVNLINVYNFGNNNIYESSGVIYTNEGYSTVTYNYDEIQVQTNYSGVDPNFGGFIEVEGNTTYTVSADILAITGSAMFNIFEYSGDPSTSTYIRVQKSSSISSAGELTKEFTTSSTTKYIIIAFYSYSTYTLEFRDLILDENDNIETGILSSQTYGNGDKISFVYNNDGQVEYIRFTDSLGTEVSRFHYLYDSYGRVSIYEDLINETSESYEYDNQGRLARVKYSNDDEIVYGYDLQGNLSNIEYNFGTITSNTHYNFETGADKDFYDFTTYNNGNNTIKKDYIYDDYNLRNLKKIQYFINSSSTSYFDLEFDYVTNTTRIDEITYNFTYSGYTDISYKYYYDSLGNITKEEYLENGAIQVKKEYVYDDYNQLIKESSRDYQYTTTSSYENTNYSKYYYYDLNGNITDIREYGYGTCDTVTYNIPSFVEINTGLYDLKMYYNTIHDYNDIYTLNIGQSPSLTFKYFDESNNVWVTGLTTNMTYSNLNVNQEGYYYRNYTATDGFFYNIQFRIVFKVGNPVNHYRDAEKHVSYSYDDDWLDQLESYNVLDNGVSKTSNITYDNQGNPIQITNFNYMGIKHNYATLEWNGRELVNITVYNSSLAVVGEIDYTYNDEGIRIKKVVQDSLGITTYHYKLSGSSLVAEIVDNGYDDTTGQRNLDYKIIYNYDYNGSLIGFTLYAQGYTFDYIYVMNQLGDVTHIITTSGTVAVEYKYDAYGNVVEIIGDANIANANSFRYRSYKYDIETDLYYLNSRYYNPEIGRFISSDGLLGQVGNIQSTNMYAYCANNPVMYSDISGEFPISFWLAVSGIILCATTSASGYAAAAVMSIWDQDVRNDMKSIGWNPFNADESKVANSKNVSFYKGQFVIRSNFGFTNHRSFSFGIMFLESHISDNASGRNTVRHEWGHFVQLSIVGVPKFLGFYAIPSMLSGGNPNYYSLPWERSADMFGGVSGRVNPYTSNSDIYSILYLIGVLAI